MSVRKTYVINDLNSLKVAKRFTVNNRSKTIIFESKQKNGILSYSTISPSEQKAIEESEMFENKVIQLAKTEKTDEVPVEETEAQKELSSANLEIEKYKELLLKQEQKTTKLENEFAEFKKLILQGTPSVNTTEAPEPASENLPTQGEASLETNEPAEKSKEYGAVTNFQQAKDVLFAEFGVSKNALTKPELIVKKAAELGVQFPNLKPVAEA